MSERAPLTDEELELLSEKILDKMLKRLAKSVALPPVDDDKRDTEPTLDDYAALRTRRKRQGRR